MRQVKSHVRVRSQSLLSIQTLLMLCVPAHDDSCCYFIVNDENDSELCLSRRVITLDVHV